MTNAEARFNKSLRPRKPEGSLGRTAQDVHLDSHTAPELCDVTGHGLHHSDRARQPRASQGSTSGTFKRVQVSGTSSRVTNQETDRGIALSQAKRCSSTKQFSRSITLD